MRERLRVPDVSRPSIQHPRIITCCLLLSAYFRSIRSTKSGTSNWTVVGNPVASYGQCCPKPVARFSAAHFRGGACNRTPHAAGAWRHPRRAVAERSASGASTATDGPQMVDHATDRGRSATVCFLARCALYPCPPARMLAIPDRGDHGTCTYERNAINVLP